MASSENAQTTFVVASGEWHRLPFFSRYSCEGSAGVDFFQQNVSVTPGSAARALGYCFPPPIIVGHVIQHLAECGAHAVVVLPDTPGYWFPRVRAAAVRSIQIPRVGSFGYPHHVDGVRDYIYHKYSMRAVEVDFRTTRDSHTGG